MDRGVDRGMELRGDEGRIDVAEGKEEGEGQWGGAGLGGAGLGGCRVRGVQG